MAELILTDKELAANLYTDLDDASIGKIVRYGIQEINDEKDQLRRIIGYGAALVLIAIARDIGATTYTVDCEGATHDGKPMGDWRIVIERVCAPLDQETG